MLWLKLSRSGLFLPSDAFSTYACAISILPILGRFMILYALHIFMASLAVGLYESLISSFDNWEGTQLSGLSEAKIVKYFQFLSILCFHFLSYIYLFA
ncbi:hypothetical protein AQUCO_06000009v1 [Aquilegia coerulea]|uniref:Uncharacterized protein n=1 Tax=Aquilegia coerulea TaxID=218851 RepID=A0A2G5CDL6_AQUCA|nr:hypothetical protein AQUCO_06000009v1 [Aquilegia coerulea]